MVQHHVEELTKNYTDANPSLLLDLKSFRMSPPTETLRNVAHSTRFNDIFSELLTASGHHASCLPYRCIIAFSIGIIIDWYHWYSIGIRDIDRNLQAERDMLKQVFALITRICALLCSLNMSAEKQKE